MSCTRIEGTELIGNVLGSPYYDKVKFMANTSNLMLVIKELRSVLPGYIYCELDNKEMRQVAELYSTLYRIEKGQIHKTYKVAQTIHLVDGAIPNRSHFNEIYPECLAKTIQYTVDMFLKHYSPV